MKFDHRAISAQRMAAAVLSLCLCASLSTLAPAQTPPAAAAPAKAAKPAAKPAEKSNADALKAYGAGTRAYEQGKMAEAVTQLTTALSSGGLPSNQMAKALYYRGAAYRKQGKPAAAISDLTSALWLKGGLNDTDRAQAVDARQAAYREAGLGDTAPPVPVQAATAPAVTPAAAPQAAAAPVQTAAAQPVPTPGTAEPAAPAPVASTKASAPIMDDGSLSSAIAIPGAAGNAPPAPAPIFGAAPIAVAAQTVPAPAAVPAPAVVAAAPAPAPAAEAVQLNATPVQDTAPPVSNTFAGAGKAVQGFFSNMGTSIGNMFGTGEAATGGTQATLTESSPVMTSSTGPVYANTPDTGSAKTGWEQAVVVAPSGAAAKPAKVTAQAPKAAAGSIRLQVAAVRSREEAERLSAKLKSTPAVQNAAATPAIDEAVIGNMGTFYRVRLGPFANAAEPDKLCAVLKPQGYDCLVVAQ